MLRLVALAGVASLTLVGASGANDTLLWGAYRPGLYFGLRPRIAESLLSGLMWFGTQDFASFTELRHGCEQNDKLDTYTWTHYDPRQGGVEIIKDSKNNLDLRIEWLKVPGGDFGGSWAVRVKGKPLDESRPLRVSMIWYHGLEGFGALDMLNEPQPGGLDGEIRFTGSSPTLGDFSLRVVEDAENSPILHGRHEELFEDFIGKTQFLASVAPPNFIWKARDVLQGAIYTTAQKVLEPYKEDARNPPDPAFTLRLTNVMDEDSNLYALQKFFSGPFSFDVFFESDKQQLDGDTLTQGVKTFTAEFDRRFAEAFPTPPKYETFSKAITSNLLGGIGYFYGTAIVDRAFVHEWDYDDADDEDDEAGKGRTGEPKLTEPRELLTATPSRSFFPRGFYWDEGFHLLHIGAWDNDLSLEIIKDWISLVDTDGWVAREQILGEEARSRVPEEFRTQHPTYANPPTLAMAVTAFIDRLRAVSSASGDIPMAELGLGQLPLTDATKTAATGATYSHYLSSPAEGVAYLREIYPALRRHYDWFRRTQRGQLRQFGRKPRSKTEAYRWRGRTETHILTSGMDDYPRARPHAGELHLDLISWMGFFTRTMKSIAVFLEEKDDEAYFSVIETGILNNIEDLHWSEEKKQYCDVGVDEDEESYHECNEGYLSLFPLLLGLLPADSPHLGHVLELMRDSEQLWSDFGLRSLSQSHRLFGEGENYWRGPIWMPMNYMALRSLFKIYMVQPGPYQQRAREIYAELRKNIIDNVHKEYERTGYVWEQYDSTTGNGQRSHPFTGWTSLVTLIISEKY